MRKIPISHRKFQNPRNQTSPMKLGKISYTIERGGGGVCGIRNFLHNWNIFFVSENGCCEVGTLRAKFEAFVWKNRKESPQIKGVGGGGGKMNFLRFISPSNSEKYYLSWFQNGLNHLLTLRGWFFMTAQRWALRAQNGLKLTKMGGFLRKKWFFKNFKMW